MTCAFNCRTREGSSRYDLALVDVYDADGFSRACHHGSFYQALWRRMEPQGLLIANLAGSASERREHLDLIVAAFGESCRVVRVDDGANHVAFAYRDPRQEPRWKWMTAQAPALQRHFGLDYPAMVRELQRAESTGWENAFPAEAWR